MQAEWLDAARLAEHRNMVSVSETRTGAPGGIEWQHLQEGGNVSAEVVRLECGVHFLGRFGLWRWGKRGLHRGGCARCGHDRIEALAGRRLLSQSESPKATQTVTVEAWLLCSPSGENQLPATACNVEVSSLLTTVMSR